MPPCTLPSNQGIYGFGIRLSFYIQWATIIAADYVFTPTHSVRERAVTFLMECAVFFALAKHSMDNDFTGVEAYICSLLISCTLVFHIPSMLWRVVCCCQEECDLSLGSRWRSWATCEGNFLTAMRFLYTLGLCCYQFWFWTTGLHTMGARDGRCPRVGFAFNPVSLDIQGLAAFHIVLYAALLVGALWTAAASVYLRRGERKRRKARRKWRRAMRR